MKRSRQSTITRQNEAVFREAVASESKKLHAKILVDLGCGDGAESFHLGEFVGAKTIMGIDHELSTLRSFIKRGGCGIASDFNQPLPLKNKSVDGIICNQVIEHVAKTDLMMAEMHRILKPGGWAIVCTPNLASWHNIFSLLFGWQPFSTQVSDQSFVGNPAHPNYNQKIDEMQAHLRVFSPRGLTDLARLHGFSIQQAKGVGYYPLPYPLNSICAKIDSLHAAYLLAVLRK